MKNNYKLIWTVCIALFFGFSQGQEAYITGTAKVKVQPNTLFYFGDNLTVSSSVNGVFENAGNVKVEGDYVNSVSGSTGANFVSTWTDNTNYGQVIINQASASGYLSMEKGKIDPATYNWGQFAVPFVYADAQEAMQGLFGTNYSNGGNRYYASMMVWDNVSKPEFDHLNNASTISPISYVILNLTYNSANIKGLMTGPGKLQYYGRPANGLHSGVMNPSMYFPALNWDDWKNQLNSHNERYHTYIDDKARTATDPDYNLNFGKYYFQFGNPYTSNIDLAYIGLPNGGANYDDGVYFSNLLGVVKSTSATWTAGVGLNTSSLQVAKFDAVSGAWSGSADALIARPFEPFVVVLKDDEAVANFEFSDKLKTFSMIPGQLGSGYVFNKMAANGTEIDTDTDAVGSLSEVWTGARKRFYQLGLRLENQDGTPTENSVYVAVTSFTPNGVANDLEADYYDFGSRTGFYLDQENPTGLSVKNSVTKMHINAVNTDYINKPIPLFFNRASGDLNSYYLKADLFFQTIFNKLEEEAVNYADGNSFFFYDGANDVLLPVTTDFSYLITPHASNSKRPFYQLYWNGGPQLNKKEIGDEFALNSTIIYKDRDLHKVRFGESWDNAIVKVYDLTGRNIQSYSNVDASVEFNIELPKGVYVVRLEETNTGEVYTQKLIK